MSNRSSENGGDDTEVENGNAITLETMREPPPSYESLDLTEKDEVGDDSSVCLLQEERDNAVGGPKNSAEVLELSTEEKKKEHDQKIKRLIADLRRECSVEEVAPEEIEMLNVGDDGLSESEMSSLQSSARGRNDLPLTLGASAHEEVTQITHTTEDKNDASLMRLSRRHSMTEAEAETNLNNNDIDHPRDEASVEDGEERPKKCGMLALLHGSPTRKLIVAGTILFCLGLLLLVILLPKSFVYVEYHEFALSRNSWTGVVDYSTVYDSGCYLLAPQDELVQFKATAHFIKQNLEIMDTTGLSINIDISLQYFLKRDEIPQLFQKYNHDYNKVMVSLVENEVKNVAVKFTLDQYRLHRQEVEATILENVQRALSGDCCDACCPDKCGRRKVDCTLLTCNPLDSCNEGYHVRVKYFQLGAITIPDIVINRHVQRIVLQVEADREISYQKRAVEVKKTEQIVQNIKNKAEELRQEARTQDKAIRMKAEAERNTIVEKARQIALMKVFSHFNISEEEIKLSYIHAHALAHSHNRDNIRFTYAYDTLDAFLP